MSNNKIQLEDMLSALDRADEVAAQHQGQQLGRLRDLGHFSFPGSTTDLIPIYLPTQEQWEAMALQVQRDQDEAFRQNHPEMFSKNSNTGVGVVRKISRA